MPNLMSVPVGLIKPHPLNPRVSSGDVDSLAASIAAVGVLEPLIVVERSEGFQLIAGHRRLAAAVKAGLEAVPCVVRDAMSAAEELEAMLIENLQRHDLAPAEEAQGVLALIGLGSSQSSIAERVGRSASWVSQRVKLQLSPKLIGLAVEANLTVEGTEDLAIVHQAHIDGLFPAGEFDKIVKEVRQGHDWALRQAAEQIEHLEGFTSAVKRLVPDGVKVFQSHYDSLPDVAKQEHTHTLVADLGLTDKEHAAESCHAVLVRQAWRSQARKWGAEGLCTAPKRHSKDGKSDLKAKAPARSLSGPRLSEKEKADRKRQSAVRKARQERFTELLESVRMPAATSKRMLLSMVVESCSFDGARVACGLLGLEAKKEKGRVGQPWVETLRKYAAGEDRSAEKTALALLLATGLDPDSWHQPYGKKTLKAVLAELGVKA